MAKKPDKPKKPKKPVSTPASVSQGLTAWYNKFVTKQAADAPPVTSPTVEPFLTGDDITALGNTMSTIDQQLGFTDSTGTFHPGSIDTNLADLAGQTAYQKTQVDQSAKENTASATDSAISRGLFQSSIKDASVYDIEAQRAIQQKFLDDRLNTATINANTTKSALETFKATTKVGSNAKAVENAAAVPVTTTPVKPQLFTPNVPAPPKATATAAQPTTNRPRLSGPSAAEAFANHQNANRASHGGAANRARAKVSL